MAIFGMESMQVNPVGTAQTDVSKSKELGQDDFLRLLVEQLKSQDPLDPMNGTEFTAQLAQFNSLEQLSNINEGLESLVASRDIMNNSRAVDYIGKTVAASGNTIYLSDGTTGDIRFELEAYSKAVYADIYDSMGNYVTRIEKEKLAAGTHTIEWDGTVSGGKLPDGPYTFEIAAVDNNDDMVQTASFISGKVTGVNFKNGNARLLAGDLEIPLESVTEVRE